jgi:O-acetyl-ADP-ribose deacetylase (regulator of RNase III)
MSPRPEVLLAKEVGGATIEAVQGDITDLQVDAIVNAANNQLWMGSGVAGAIKARGGNSIEDEAVSKGPIPVTSAVETRAGSLEAKFVIHAAVMGPDLRTDLHKVRVTTRSTLELAKDLGLESLALPLLGTGVGGLDPDLVALAMAEEATSMVRGGGYSGMRILLVGFGLSSGLAAQRAVESI